MVPAVCAYRVPSDIPMSVVTLLEPLCVGLLPALKDPLARLITHHVSIGQLPDVLDNLSHHRIGDSIKVVVDMV